MTALLRRRGLTVAPHGQAADARPRAQRGLVTAIGATMPGASWQRCRTHYAVNLMSVTPKSSWPGVRTLLHSVYDQSDARVVHEHGGQIWSNNAQQRLNRESRRRTDVRRDLPRPRQRHPVLAEQHEEWIEGRRYFGLDVLQRSGLTRITNPTLEEVSEPLTAAGLGTEPYSARC